MVERQIYYAIIQIPKNLIDAALELAPKADVKKKGLVLSTDSKNPHHNAITTEDNYIEKWKKEGQNAATLYLPIKQTNRWTKLPKEHMVRIDLYYSPIKRNNKKLLHEFLEVES